MFISVEHASSVHGFSSDGGGEEQQASCLNKLWNFHRYRLVA